jgi:secondary thiamine-phosphate synthase enzyme
MVHQKALTIPTTGNGDMHDVTERVQHVVRESNVRTGLAHVFVVGSTAAVGAIEFEPGLREDLPALLNRLIPPSHSYGHERTWHDGNGHSHLQATMLGPELTVPVRDGTLATGTWQQIVLLECDIRSRTREVVVTVSGE